MYILNDYYVRLFLYFKRQPLFLYFKRQPYLNFSQPLRKSRSTSPRRPTSTTSTPSTRRPRPRPSTENRAAGAPQEINSLCSDWLYEHLSGVGDKSGKGFALGHYLIRGALQEFCPRLPSQTSVPAPDHNSANSEPTPAGTPSTTSNYTPAFASGGAVAIVIFILSVADVVLGSSTKIRKLATGKGRGAQLCRLMFKVLRY